MPTRNGSGNGTKAGLVAVPLLALAHVHPPPDAPVLSQRGAATQGGGICWICRASQPQSGEIEIDHSDRSLALVGRAVELATPAPAVPLPAHRSTRAPPRG